MKKVIFTVLLLYGIKIMSNFYQQKSILVTGGAGFIGSHIVEELVKQGAFVCVLDNLSTGSLDNLSSVINDITVIQGDITSFSSCLAATHNQQIIFHCAAMVSVPESIEKPRLCSKVNVAGTYNLLEAARINRVERFIFSSSAAVYGNQENPCKETELCEPTSPYGLSKLISEQYCQLYTKLFNLPTLCLRYFNVYGKRQQTQQHGIYEKIRAAMRDNRSITVFGDGEQTRDFISVNEVTEANLLLAQLPTTYLNGQAINIATGKNVSINILIEKFKQEFPHYKNEISYEAARYGDIKHSSAAVEKYKKLKELMS
ncbi:TPA: LPS biosynthesis protein WbpP [Candidatus Dependentiae bacterium]|nr:MAG: hypothetical protein US03_C0007G0004 [candidate division TM6 bacterium GW2011_GWF2_36_131]KKQ02722.1 MAG: hypothetical protein US13_C0011G0030 [candidate division TM6 bacterium GW2011_GWE2_36_25]KKQ19609.1 MAG: hypothetical protein US32_C0007G0062 [candidate division TM6 bacterium GW2011_GWA2_36_9]HBR71123.1 LPS biosynthesis protein WbpP [Candidatus Dependentiae bacterium]HCU00981.1 LPS biosynthesis protein WbpP [Candidatus Dependentiae bacterium]